MEARLLSDPPRPSADPPRVELAGLGVLEGEYAVGGPSAVAQFLAIPFAAPVDGPCRWAPPRPPVPWAPAVRRNPFELPRCPQPRTASSRTFHAHRVVDDESACLNLNVFIPLAADRSAADDSLALLPIVFYIHGGAGKLGSAHEGFDSLSAPTLAAGQRVVVVTTQYRLGALGFLAHPELAAEDEERAADGGEGWSAARGARERGVAGVAGCGNYAVLDLLAALRWVQAHAAAFRGDASNVTIFGLSTGAQVSPQRFWLLLSASERCLWVLLGVFGSFCALLSASGRFWLLLSASARFCGRFVAPECLFGLSRVHSS